MDQKSQIKRRTFTLFDYLLSAIVTMIQIGTINSLDLIFQEHYLTNSTDISNRVSSVSVMNSSILYSISNSQDLKMDSLINASNVEDPQLRSKIVNATDSTDLNNEYYIITGNEIIEIYSSSKKGTFHLFNTCLIIGSRVEQYIPRKLAAIQTSNYFLSGAQVAQGISRWEISDNSQSSVLNITKIPNGYSTNSLTTLTGSKLAAVSFYSFPRVLIFDTTTMEILSRIEVGGGLLSPLGIKPPNTSLLVTAVNNNLSLLNYTTGRSVLKMETQYYITAIKAVDESEVMIVAENRRLRAFSMLSISEELSSSDQTIIDIKLDDTVKGIINLQQQRRVVIFGQNYIYSLSSKDIAPAQCHESCQGCNSLFSSYACEKCSSDYKLTIGRCINPKRQNFNFQKVAWSTPNQQSRNKGLNRVVVLYLVVILCGLLCLMFASLLVFWMVCRPYKTNMRAINRGNRARAVLDTEIQESDRDVFN